MPYIIDHSHLRDKELELLRVLEEYVQSMKHCIPSIQENAEQLKDLLALLPAEESMAMAAALEMISQSLAEMEYELCMIQNMCAQRRQQRNEMHLILDRLDKRRN